MTSRAPVPGRPRHEEAGGTRRVLIAGGTTVMKRIAVAALSLLIAVAFAMFLWAMNPDTAKTAAGGYVKKCGGGEILLNQKEQKTFVLHNGIRRDHNLPTFCVHPVLQKAARAHSKDMIQRGYFSHDTKGGGTAGERLKDFGYDSEGYSYYAVGENIAYGSGSYGEPDNIMSGWMKSRDHRRNILNGKFREIGIGAYTGTYRGNDGVTMYTTDFGVRRR